MTMNNSKAKEKDSRDLIKDHCERNGIKQKFVADYLKISNGHFTQILNKERGLTDENRRKINELWGTDY